MLNANTLRNDTDQVYREVMEELCLTCSKKVALDVNLKIRHSSSLIMKNMDLN